MHSVMLVDSYIIFRGQTFVKCPSAIRKNSEKALLYGMPRAEKEGKIGAQRAFQNGLLLLY